MADQKNFGPQIEKKIAVPLFNLITVCHRNAFPEAENQYLNLHT